MTDSVSREAVRAEIESRIFRLGETEAHALLDAIRALTTDSGDACLDDVWRQAREKHVNHSATGCQEQDIRFLALALAGEAGELANFVKKRWRDGEGHDEDLRLECADVLAYTMILADALGMTPADLIAAVAHKQGVFVEKMAALATRKQRKDE